ARGRPGRHRHPRAVAGDVQGAGAEGLAESSPPDPVSVPERGNSHHPFRSPSPEGRGGQGVRTWPSVPKGEGHGVRTWPSSCGRLCTASSDGPTPEPMPDLRTLQPGDEAALDAFLARHAESSMFLRSNARAAGLVDRGEPLQATYVAAIEGGAIVAVVAHC